MATIRGERFNIDLIEDGFAPRMNTDDADDDDGAYAPTSAFIGDVQERVTTGPAPPTFKSNGTGFPAHKKRTGASRFRQSRTTKDADDEVDALANSAAPLQQGSVQPASKGSLEDLGTAERRDIDAENKQRLADMSAEEIAQERQELFAGLSPGLVQKLLKRSTIDSDTTSNSSLSRTSTGKSDELSRPPNSGRKVSFALPDPQPDEEIRRSPTAERHSLSDSPLIRPVPAERKVSFALPDPGPEEERRSPSAEKHSISESPHSVVSDKLETEDVEALQLSPSPPDGSVHFPRPPSAPELDPNSDTFLDELHEKYFPTLSHDPSKLAWMIPATDEENATYDPSQSTLTPADLRFNFKGALIPPSVANSLSTDLGLHHHGEAPSAAGYTIPELARLSRSSFAAQRCIAFQTLGRILYRLGIGEFGNENDMDVHGPDGERAKMAKGLWEAVEESRVVESLTEEAKKEIGHQTSIAMAQEAVWNWRRGGGRQRKAV